MEVFIILFLIILIVLIITYFIYKIKNSSNKKELDDIVKSENNKIQEEKESFFPMVQIIENNEIIPSKKRMISNPKVKNALTTIEHLSPQATTTAKNIKNTIEVNEKVLFSASKKDAQKMLNAGKNQFYGTQISSKTKKITDQTKFTKETGLTKNMTK